MRAAPEVRLAVALLLIALVAIPCCRRRALGSGKPRVDALRTASVAPRPEVAYVPVATNRVLVTGYCNCGTCCAWKRSWFGFGAPVYSQGPLKGRPKRVGITASGTRARSGTIAADTSMFPFGTVLAVPGYGTGLVEDVGGGIRGKHIDVWFPSHTAAKRWGAKWLDVVTYKPVPRGYPKSK